VWRPVWLLVAGLALVPWLMFIDHHIAQSIRHDYAGRAAVVASPTEDWDGSWYLPVTYRHPSGQVVRASTYVGHDDLIPGPGDTVLVQVSRTDPTQVRVVGDRYHSTPWGWYLPWALPGLLLLMRRRLWVRRTERAAADAVLTEPMRGVPAAPGWWSWRWRLHLYPLSAAEGTAPVATVPLIAEPSILGELAVDVAGRPHRWRRAVARLHDSGEVLWPSGRCRLTSGVGRRRRAPGRSLARSGIARALFALGAVVLVVGVISDVFVDDYSAVADRGYRIEATVTGVTYFRVVDRSRAELEYSWLGQPLTGRVTAGGAVHEGQRLAVIIDPQVPSRVWLRGQDPPVGGDWPVGIWLLGLALMGVAFIIHLVSRHNAQAPPRAAPPPPPPAVHTPPPPYGYRPPLPPPPWSGSGLPPPPPPPPRG
jgi:hypothetical protein